MSNIDKLTYLNETKRQLREAINDGFGAGLTEDTPFRDYAIPLYEYHIENALFARGVEGAWYDPSDLSTLFKDAAGTIPVTGTGDPVGLMLDKSKGLGLGPELVTNGMFDTDISGWIASPQYQTSSAVEWVNGALHGYNTKAGYSASRSAAIPLTIGKRYVLEMDILDGTAAGYWIIIGSSPDSDTAGRIAVTSSNSSSGYKRWRYSFVASYATAYLYFATSPALGSHLYADNISVRELHGNHVTQTVSAARPTYRTDGELHWLEFDGADDSFTLSFTTPVKPENSIYMGFNAEKSGTYPYLITQVSGYGQVTWRLNPTQNSLSITQIGTSIDTGFAFGSANVISVDSGSVVTVRTNGVQTAAAPMSKTSLRELFIGSQLGLRNYSKFKFYGMLVFEGGVYSSVAGAYLANKSGVTL